MFTNIPKIKGFTYKKRSVLGDYFVNIFRGFGDNFLGAKRPVFLTSFCKVGNVKIGVTRHGLGRF